MTYNLTIDQGNTSTKLAVWEYSDDNAENCKFVDGRCMRRPDLQEVHSLCERYKPFSAIYCSVSEHSDELVEILHEHCGKRVIDLSADTRMPISVSYATPGTLGMDRLAAAVGAHAMASNAGREIFVADIGTAITYDHVTADNRYVGGNIAPGIYMRLRALNSFTARLPQVETAGDVPLWGYDTESALRSGAINGVVAELEFYRRRLGPDAVTVLTGGAAGLVAPLLTFEAVTVPNLVCLGLNAILLYNHKINHD